MTSQSCIQNNLSTICFNHLSIPVTFKPIKIFLYRWFYMGPLIKKFLILHNLFRSTIGHVFP